MLKISIRGRSLDLNIPICLDGISMLFRSTWTKKDCTLLRIYSLCLIIGLENIIQSSRSHLLALMKIKLSLANKKMRNPRRSITDPHPSVHEARGVLVKHC
jgi:hypothetical protein